MFPGRFQLERDGDLIDKMPKILLYNAKNDVFRKDSDDLVEKLKDNLIETREFPGNNTFYQISYSPDTLKFFESLRTDIDDFWNNVHNYKFTSKERNLN